MCRLLFCVLHTHTHLHYGNLAGPWILNKAMFESFDDIFMCKLMTFLGNPETLWMPMRYWAYYHTLWICSFKYVFSCSRWAIDIVVGAYLGTWAMCMNCERDTRETCHVWSLIWRVSMRRCILPCVFLSICHSSKAKLIGKMEMQIKS